MTDIEAKKINSKVPPFISSSLCIALTIISIYFSGEIKDGIYQGLKFSFLTLIPTLFPFFILSDLWGELFYVNPNGKISRGFEKIFMIGGSAVSAMICGMIFGFPVGAKAAMNLYSNGIIDKDELERLCGFINIPSCAFVISGVGSAILGEPAKGVLLYLGVILSAIITGMLFRGTRKNVHKENDNPGQTFNMAKSIVSAGVSSITVASCIAFFCGVISLVSKFVKKQYMLLLIASILEISNAVQLISKCNWCPTILRIMLLSFALGFSGASVHIQVLSLMPKEFSVKKYLSMKIFQGIACAVISAILFSISTLA